MSTTTPATETEQRAAARLRHPSGRRLRATVVTLAAAGMLAAATGTASAHTHTPGGPTYQPHNAQEATEVYGEEPAGCGPYTDLGGGRCGYLPRLDDNDLHGKRHDTVNAWGWVVLGGLALASLLP